MSSRGLRLPWQLEFTQQLSSLNPTLASSSPVDFCTTSVLASICSLSQTFLAQPSVFEPGLPSSRFSMRALVASQHGWISSTAVYVDAMTRRFPQRRTLSSSSAPFLRRRRSVSRLFAMVDQSPCDTMTKPPQLPKKLFFFFVLDIARQ